jgi:hypothetical protein
MTGSDGTPDALAWALQHLELGFAPVPVVRGSRATYVPWKPWQAQRPTEADILEWFAEPGRNIALVCGAFHRLVMVDADSADAVRFCKVHFPPTPYRLITRRGMHFYYRHPGGDVHVQTKARVFGDPTKVPGAPEVDIRGDGGIATALGSVHKSGHIYRLAPDADMASPHDLPLWDNAWLPRPEPIKPPTLWRGAADLGALDRAERYLAKVGGAGKGGRNQHTFRVASAVVRDFGLSLEQGWALMSAWNTVSNDPPLPEDELRTIVRSCLQSGKRPVGWRILGNEGCWAGASTPLRSSLRRLDSHGGCR